jgi:hypothetical protein
MNEVMFPPVDEMGNLLSALIQHGNLELEALLAEFPKRCPILFVAHDEHGSLRSLSGGHCYYRDGQGDRQGGKLFFLGEALSSRGRAGRALLPA